MVGELGEHFAIVAEHHINWPASQVPSQLGCVADAVDVDDQTALMRLPDQTRAHLMREHI